MKDDRADAAEDLWQRIITLAESIPDDAWHRPTPCERWDVHDVVAHLPAVQHLFDGGPQHQPPDGWQPPDGLTGLDVWTEAGVVARRGWPKEQLLAMSAKPRNATSRGCARSPTGTRRHRARWGRQYGPACSTTA